MYCQQFQGIPGLDRLSPSLSGGGVSLRQDHLPLRYGCGGDTLRPHESTYKPQPALWEGRKEKHTRVEVRGKISYDEDQLKVNIHMMHPTTTKALRQQKIKLADFRFLQHNIVL